MYIRSNTLIACKYRIIYRNRHEIKLNVTNFSTLSSYIPRRGGSSFLLRGGGGFDQNNDDAEHRPRAAKRRADFWGGVYLNPVSDVFLASINTMETIKSSA